MEGSRVNKQYVAVNSSDRIAEWRSLNRLALLFTHGRLRTKTCFDFVAGVSRSFALRRLGALTLKI